MNNEYVLMDGATEVGRWKGSNAIFLPPAPDGQTWIAVSGRMDEISLEMDGDYYVEVPRVFPEETLRQQLRVQRNILLAATDATQVREDYTEEQKSAWADYRQSLRDWPETEPNVYSPTEPTPPDDLALQDMINFWTSMRSV